MEQHEVVTCTSGKDALDLLQQGKWDLVISDVMMPNMSGYELTRKIRERFSISELPVILLTARSQLEDIQTGFYSGATDYVTKPVERLEIHSEEVRKSNKPPDGGAYWTFCGEELLWLLKTVSYNSFVRASGKMPRSSINSDFKSW